MTTLLARAVARLEAGPVHSTDLAKGILGLSGPPEVLSTAVTTLLGADRRFRVSGDGMWSLERVRHSTPLNEVKFAVTDVESTGGTFATGHRIIDIGVAQVEGGVVGELWDTLVNPGRWVPSGVQYLTGIDDGVLGNAPWFDHIAQDLADRLEGRVFVAHNVRFDWHFVSASLADCMGVVPSMRRLCTIRMSRRLLPKLRRHNLDALSRYFCIPNHARHRAGGDALATARVLVRLLDEAQAQGAGDIEGLEQMINDGIPGRKRRKRQNVEALAIAADHSSAAEPMPT